MVVVIMSSKRFYPADHSLLLFAQFLDNYCLRQLTDQCRDFADLCFGGAEVVQYRDEVKLIAHLMYYCSCLLSIHATLGQQFCGLSLFRTLPSSNSSAGERITKPTDKFGMLNTYLSTALVYSVLPYVYAKKTVIWGKLCDVCDLLFSSEPDAYDISDRRTPSRDSAASPSDTDSLQLQHTVNNNHKPSYLSLMVNAVYRSITSISNEVDVRLERMFNYLIELHFLIFLYNSRYLEFPLRMENLQLYGTTAPKIQIKLKSLAWLLGFRLALLSYYGLRVMFNEMGNAMRESKQQQAAEQTTEVSKKTDVKEESIEGQNSRSSFGLCSVCLDNVSHPAALPCGHICCWNCIMPYAIKQQNDCKCPVCRSEFESRNVLALCNYS